MKLEDYTKAEIILAIRGQEIYEWILQQKLPDIRYKKMLDEAQKIGEEALAAAKKNYLEKSIKLFDESNAMYQKANKFIENIQKQRSKNEL